jgi:hypothetical protein
MTRDPRKPSEPRQPGASPGPHGRFNRRQATLALAAGAALLAGACGGGEERKRRRSPVRLVNASTGYDSLELRVDDQLLQAAVAYGERAAYAEADPDEPEVTVFSTGSPTALWRGTPSAGARPLVHPAGLRPGRGAACAGAGRQPRRARCRSHRAARGERRL